MSDTRRGFIRKGIVGSLLPMVACDQEPVVYDDPEPWDETNPLDDETFPFGVQVGDATNSSVVCSVQTQATSVQMLLLVVDKGAWITDQETVLNDVQDGFIQWELMGLKADTLYTIMVHTDQGYSRPTEFRTALSSDQKRLVRFGATSCLGGNWSWPSLSIASMMRYDFFCFLGDAVYADGSTTKAQYWQHWKRTLSQQGFLDVTSSTSIVCTWDDHEVDNNWSWNDIGISTRFPNALHSFRRALPQRQGPGGTGIWRRLDWGRTLSLFILDSRGERRDGMYVSTDQMDWLKDELKNQDATFSLILSSVPFTDFSPLLGNTQAEDRWQGYAQREELLLFLEEESIQGVVFISGDFHFGEVCHVSPQGELGEKIVEVLVGPGGSFLNPMGGMIPQGPQFMLGVSEWNYTEFVCDPELGTIAIAFIGDEGKVLEETVISVL